MEEWSNYSCLGYVIKSMQDLNFKDDEIKAVVSKMKYNFDMKTLKEASSIYCDSNY